MTCIQMAQQSVLPRCNLYNERDSLLVTEDCVRLSMPLVGFINQLLETQDGGVTTKELMDRFLFQNEHAKCYYRGRLISSGEIKFFSFPFLNDRSMREQSWLLDTMTFRLWRIITAPWHSTSQKILRQTYSDPSRPKSSNPSVRE